MKIKYTKWYCLAALTFLIPALGILAGLSIAATVTIFLILSLTCLSKGALPLSQVREEVVWCCWCLLSCLWTSDQVSSLIVWLKLFSMIFLGLFIKNNIDRLTISSKKIELYFILGICCAIVLFFIEYFSCGLLSKTYRSIFQSDSRPYFRLFMLDRGCALLSLLSWVVIGILIKQKKNLLAIIFYILILCLLCVSDSLASFLGFTISGLVFCICKFITARLLKFISFGLILGSLFMPIIAYNINPIAISTQYEGILPFSSIHRIFIWHFVTNKALEKPILGWGFDASRKFKINNDERIQYKADLLSPLPLHPHNNILQAWLETGLIGLILFLLIIYKYSTKIIQFIIKGRATLNFSTSNFGLISYACFINYYIIGMISFGVWQLWWVSSGIWSAIMMDLLVKQKQGE